MNKVFVRLLVPRLILDSIFSHLVTKTTTNRLSREEEASFHRVQLCRRSERASKCAKTRYRRSFRRPKEENCFPSSAGDFIFSISSARKSFFLVEKCDVKIEHAKLRSPQCQLILRSEIRFAVSTRVVINIEIFAQFSIQLRLSSSSGCEISKVLQASFRTTTVKSFTMQEDVCWWGNLVVRRSHMKLKQLKTFRKLSVAAANPSSDLRSPASHQIFLQSCKMRREICYIIILNWSRSQSCNSAGRVIGTFDMEKSLKCEHLQPTSTMSLARKLWLIVAACTHGISVDKFPSSSAFSVCWCTTRRLTLAKTSHKL